MYTALQIYTKYLLCLRHLLYCVANGNDSIFYSERNRRKAELSESPLNTVLKTALQLISLFDLDLEQIRYTDKNETKKKNGK